MRQFSILIILFCNAGIAHAQPYSRDVKAEYRQKMYKNIVSHSINDNLSTPLTAENETSWQYAFEALQLLNYTSPFVEAKLQTAVTFMPINSVSFNTALIALLYQRNYAIYAKQIFDRLPKIQDVALLAISIKYLLKVDTTAIMRERLTRDYKKQLQNSPSTVLQMLADDEFSEVQILPDLKSFFKKTYLPRQTIVFSFQRKNRDYPGLAMVRDTAGRMQMVNDSTYFSVPQLARSQSNLPFYFFNANTPQGIFRMSRFDTSKVNFIGPSTNLQLTMPWEYKPSHFYQDSTLSDTWSTKNYADLLPENFRKYGPLFQSFNAGKIGRSFIIAHGTTIDPEYYRGSLFYPLTPTQGCLTSKEIWDEKTGYLKDSDQLMLMSEIRKAGGPRGYLIVIELDNLPSAVRIDEVVNFIKEK